jgi:hypothetical protein
LLSAKSHFSQTANKIYLLIHGFASQFSTDVFEASTEIVFCSHDDDDNKILYHKSSSLPEYLSQDNFTLYQSIFHLSVICELLFVVLSTEGFIHESSLLGGGFTGLIHESSLLSEDHEFPVHVSQLAKA